ncbi:putative lipase [Spathaspora sp. JA1]|nr:putative lipase [Spathaspora sp. JA1]
MLPWYRDRDNLRIGGVNRYTLTYTRQDPSTTKVYLRLKNIEKSSIRAIHLLNGPFILYCHVIPYNYNPHKQFNPDDVRENTEVLFDNQIKPNQSFNATLLLNKNSLVSSSEQEGDKFQWEIDIISQIVVSRKATILYDLMIGDDLELMTRLSRNKISQTLNNLSSPLSPEIDEKVEEFNRQVINHQIYNPQVKVVKQTAEEMWNNEPKDPSKPIHLIIVTHGIFSNLTADMLYLKDTLESKVQENILVRGYQYNAGLTERGIKTLGSNVATYIISLIETSPYIIDKISFIAHSLGGPVQLYAIKYILQYKGGDYFEKLNIQPQNLITMASPLLGILNELSFLISWVLDIGTLGKTGRDLALSKRIPTFADLYMTEEKRKTFKPILETLPDNPLQQFLTKFKSLTLYANAINDGIVPLRTSALLYLDYEALGDVSELKKTKHVDDHPELEDPKHPIETNLSRKNVSEVPEYDVAEDEKKSQESIHSKDQAEIWQLAKQPITAAQELYQQLLNSNSNNNKLTKRQKKYMRFTAKGTDYNLFEEVLPDNDNLSQKEGKTSSTTTDEENDDENNFQEKTIVVPPKASAIASAINALICPVPTTNFIINPQSRHHVIFHDKYYHFDNIPKQDSDNSSSSFNAFFKYHGKWKQRKQVIIANKFHGENLNWRKVLVNLPPDAHNNIVVRRRFANGYGWGVIDHLCENLFDRDSMKSKI